MVDAPVSGGPHDIAAGQVTLFVGGADDAVARVRPVLGGYGDPILHVGPHRCGPAVKLVNNTLFAAQIGLLAEAVRLGDRLGIDEAALLDAMRTAARQPGVGSIAQRGFGRRRSSTRSASSSARTSPWCARPPPNWAAISARSTTWSTPDSGR